VHDYLVKNQDLLLAEDEEEKAGTDGFESLDEYMRYGRD
jgi:hypothetical protein